MITWSPGITLDDMEKMIIQKAYSFYKGNKTKTASALGIAYKTLDCKLDKYKQEDTDANGLRSKTGVLMESVDEVPEKPTLPLPIGGKVQEVLLEKNGNRSKK